MKRILFALKRWQRITFTLIVAVFLLAGEFLFYTHRKAVVESIQYQEIKAVAQLKVNQLNQWIIERQGDAQVVSQSPFFSGEVFEWLNNAPNLALMIQLQDRLQLLKNSNQYQGVFIVNSSGELLLSTQGDSTALGSDYSERMGNLHQLNSGIYYDFYLCPIHQSVHFDFLAPIGNSHHQDTTYLMLRVDPKNYFFPLIETWPAISSTSETEVFKKEGDSVLFLNNLRHKSHTAFAFRVSLDDSLSPVVHAISGETGFFNGVDYRGHKVLAYIQKIPNLNWFMVAKKDHREIYAELYRNMLIITIFVIVLILILVLGFTLIYSQQKQRSMQDLLQKEIELLQNQQEGKAILYSIGDGVITTDSHGLITRMNPVAEQLTGWSEEQSNGMPLSEIFQIIDKESRSPAANPVDSILKQDQAAGLFMNILLVSKNNTEIPISQSVAPIFNGDKEIVGVVLVFRDQTEEYAANQALVASEAKFRNLFEHSPIGKSMTGIDGSLNVNQAFCDMLGYSRVEMQAMKWMEISPPEDAEKSQEVVQLLLQGKIENARFEKRYFHKKGHTIWTDISTYLQRDKDGNPLFFITAINDISEYKNTMEALKKSEFRLRSTLDNMLEGAQILDKNQMYLYINDAAEAHNRRPKHELLGKKYADVWPGIQQTRVYQVINDCLQNNTTHHFENEFVFPDGYSGWFELSIQPVPEGVFILSMDITARKIKEKNLIQYNNELEERVVQRTHELNDLYHKAPCGYHSLDNKGLIELINDTELEWLGYTRNELVGKVYAIDLLTDESKAVFRTNFPVFLKTGLLSNLELDFVRKDGSILSVLLNATALYDAEGNYLRSRSTLTDHTQKKKTDKDLFHALKKLEETNKDLESFSYSVSHDLRAPLRHISGYVELLMEQTQNSLSEKGKHYLNTINDAALQLGKLIDELLQFSRTGRKDIVRQPIDLNQMISDVLTLLVSDTLNRTIEWRIAEFPLVYGDNNLLTLVWTNLISNALKFTQKKETAKIEIGYTENESNYQFYIKDNGAGFDMLYAQKLFGVFQRMHTPQEFEGTGIGLANVKRIITKHGGTVWANAEIHKGAVFYFTLPKFLEEKE